MLVRNPHPAARLRGAGDHPLPGLGAEPQNPAPQRIHPASASGGRSRSLRVRLRQSVLFAALALLLLALPPLPRALAQSDQETRPASDEIYALSDVPEADTETRIDEPERPAFVQALLDVAIGELGYTEGPNNYSKYGEWSGDPNAAWCAEFVCWCVSQADARTGTQLLDTVYPNYSGQNTGRDWFVRKGRFVFRRGNCPEWGYQWLKGADRLMKKNDYIPRSGDLVFFSYNEAGDTEHVALVEYCARDAQERVVIHVIEGNNPSSVQRNRYYLNNSQVLGFGACEDVADTTMRYGNRGDKVLELQRRLCELGYLEAQHQTGTYGSNTKLAVAAYQSAMANKAVTGIADRETQQAIEADMREMEFNSPETWQVVDE